MTVIVTGGAGFIGTHLLERMVGDGMQDIVSIDTRDPKSPVEGVDYRKADIRDLSAFEAPAQVDFIYHLAGVHTTPGHPPWEFYDVNVSGTIETVRLARRCGAKRIVFTSTMSVYALGETEKLETTKPDPVNDYGRSKLIAEEILRDWLEESEERRLVISRPSVVFGRGEGGNFTRLARVLEKGFFVYPGRKDTIKSCIYVEELVDWIQHAAGLDEQLILFNGAYSQRYTIEDIVNAFREVAFPNVKTVLVPAWLLKGVAGALRPFSAAGLGIHPERVEKLMNSTNIVPDWAKAKGLTDGATLEIGLKKWRARGGGHFA